MSNSVIRYAKLSLPFNLAFVQEEVKALPARWKSHLNTSQYEGGWTVLALRAPGGDPENIAADPLGKGDYANTPLLDHTPTIRSLLDSLPSPLLSARLLQLSPGALIKEHKDPDLSFERGEARLHFPIVTHPAIEFFIEGERVDMQEGECWYINANLPHRVSNPGPRGRIHLVVDCVVNDALKELFASSERQYSNVVVPQREQMEVIKALRLLNTETASRMADEMEQQLQKANNG